MNAKMLCVGAVAAVCVVVLASSRVLAQSAAPDPAPVDSLPSGDVAGRLDGVTEQVQAMQADVDKLKKFKFSG